MLIAPTEPVKLKEIGTVSLAPERRGVDVLWASAVTGLVGVQRKEFPGDFVSSKSDGRLAKEFAQMQSLNVAVLVLEGPQVWTIEGALLHPYGEPWTKSKLRRYLCSVRARGIWVERTDSLADTIAFVRDLEEWSKKAKHHSTEQRPGVKRDGWGRASDRDYLVHFLQGLPGVGPELAGRMVDTIGCPFSLSATEEELRSVHGMGKAKAKTIRRMFGETDG